MHIKKGKFNFHHRDVIDLTDTLSVIILEGLKKFKELERHGVPADFITFDEDHPNGYLTEEKAQEWENALDQMIFAFEPEKDYYEVEPQPYDIYLKFGSRFTTVETKLRGEATEADLEQYKIREAAWKKDYHEKRQEGRRLFALYFPDLWD